MSSRAPDLLSSIFATGLQPKAKEYARSLIPMKVRGSSEESAGEFTPPVSKRRTAIWDMHPSVHCSIIGTCLSSGEIRRLLIKLGVHGAESASDHDLHKQGVALASRQQGGAKFIQKALDRRHEAAIKQFAKADDESALRQTWDEAVRRGDIPGAYWAVLSHPAATDGIMRKTFGDVHMLSHMVGAANRAAGYRNAHRPQGPATERQSRSSVGPCGTAAAALRPPTGMPPPRASGTHPTCETAGTRRRRR